MKYKIYNQDVIEWAKEYQKGKFHALISDAPYHLTSIVKRFGKKDSAPAQFGTDGVFSRASKGFMGQEWDGGDVAFRPETWEAICEHLYPGAFGMVFSASRNWHRLAVAIEDAGMVIHPTIFGWLNGQGFPKATNISKKLDYHDGSQNWEGHRYGLQALKPAVEPIIVFQKPYEGRPLDNIVATGAGAINIDGGRIPVDSPVTINRFTNGAKPWGDAKGEEFDTVQTVQGRWPANFILDESSATLLDSKNRDTKGKRAPRGGTSPNPMSWGDVRTDGDKIAGYDDAGGISRFFYNVQEQIDDADPIYYCSKVSPRERNAGLDDRCIHPTMKPIALAKYLATLLLPPEGYAPRRILVPFSGVMSEAIGCALAGWEQIVCIEFMKEYAEIGKKRMDYWKDKNEINR